MAANLTMTGTPHLADPHAPIRFTAVAGEAFAAGDVGFIHTDGLAYNAMPRTIPGLPTSRNGTVSRSMPFPSDNR